MSCVVAKYKKEIQALNTLDNLDYTYNPKQWSKLNKNAKTLVSAYENKNISRKDLINAFAQYYDDQDRSVNSAGGNIYGDSRFSMEANPNSNMSANPDSNINANPDTYINDNPNFPSNIHNPSDGWNGQGQ